MGFNSGFKGLKNNDLGKIKEVPINKGILQQYDILQHRPKNYFLCCHLLSLFVKKIVEYIAVKQQTSRPHASR
jgi:hypothetical protein